MHPLLMKILVLIPMLALLTILTYKKINEGFTVTTPQTTQTTQTTRATTLASLPISAQLSAGIASTLGVSLRRIQNLTYSGNLANLTLSVGFTILEPNIIESAKGEPSATSVGAMAKSMFVSNQFSVPVNDITIRLTRINNTDTGATPAMNPEDYFNNKGLLDSANYAKQVFTGVPVDSAATRFFTLKPDANFNLMPVL